MPAACPEEFRRRAVDLVRQGDESVSAYCSPDGDLGFWSAKVGGLGRDRLRGPRLG